MPTKNKNPLATLRHNDRAWVVNSLRNRAMPVTVVFARDDAIVVLDRDRERLLSFDPRTGLPTLTDTFEDEAPQPRLVPLDTPRALELDRRRAHRAYRERVGDAANDFRLFPTEENLAKMQAVVDEWAAHSLGLKVNASVEYVLREAGLPDMED